MTSWSVSLIRRAMPRPVACSSCRRRCDLPRSPLIALECSSCRRRCDLPRSPLIALDCSSCRRRFARQPLNPRGVPAINGLRWIAIDCLPHQVGATRRTLAACLLRASLAAAGRGRCAHALHLWAVAVHAHERIRTVLDVRTANRAAEVRSPLIVLECL